MKDRAIFVTTALNPAHAGTYRSNRAPAHSWLAVIPDFRHIQTPYYPFEFRLPSFHLFSKTTRFKPLKLVNTFRNSPFQVQFFQWRKRTELKWRLQSRRKSGRGGTRESRWRMWTSLPSAHSNGEEEYAINTLCYCYS